MTRSHFLRVHIEEIMSIIRSDIPLIGYLHWSLFDNYEWGTFTPRFGLYSINYAKDNNRLVEDHLGDRPSATYAELIQLSREESESSQSEHGREATRTASGKCAIEACLARPNGRNVRTWHLSLPFGSGRGPRPQNSSAVCQARIACCENRSAGLRFGLLR